METNPTPIVPSNPTPPPAAPQIPPAPVANPVPQPVSHNPWPWIVGGCLMIVILIMATTAILIWWGARTVQKEIKESDAVERIEKSIEKATQEGDKWQKKSEEFRESMPDPEDFSGQIPK